MSIVFLIGPVLSMACASPGTAGAPAALRREAGGSPLTDVGALVHPAEIVIRNDDPPGWGLNDPRPFQPVGGNPATTLGEARLSGARRAAQVWASRLQSRTPIVLAVSFNHESCREHKGLANGGPGRLVTVFPGEHPEVGYAPALANAMAGRDLNGSEPEGRIQVVAVFDDEPRCLGGAWYYGFDHPNHFSQYGLDYVSVLFHEIGHSLGFSSYMEEDGGALSAFDLHVYDETLGKAWPDLTSSQRKDAAAKKHNVTWNGPSTNAAAVFYPFAATNGHLRLDVPNGHLSHWEGETTGGYVGLTMSGSRTNEVRSDHLDVTPCVLQDMGWPLMPGQPCLDVAH
jgi:hypothetical protein